MLGCTRSTWWQEPWREHWWQLQKKGRSAEDGTLLLCSFCMNTNSRASRSWAYEVYKEVTTNIHYQRTWMKMRWDSTTRNIFKAWTVQAGSALKSLSKVDTTFYTYAYQRCREVVVCSLFENFFISSLFKSSSKWIYSHLLASPSETSA